MKLTPLKAIKKHCLECSGFEKKQVRECVIKDCVLYEYRLGKNPNRKGSTIKKLSAFSSQLLVKAQLVENSSSRDNFM